ncbi:CGNR zinc finger domain-containing protein [Streptomyces physcomitrii]|uniref:CGNR zinc finger domain-containing protein n=1 Tax=Streptomyces physcomitrii TaxID=2724184 RepID=UPI003438EC7B
MTSSAYEWSTRHSVLTNARRTAALVNVLSEEDTGPEAVAEVLRAYGERGPLTLTEAEVSALREVARQLRTVFAADGTDAAAEALNQLLARTPGALRLSAHQGGTPWHPHLDSSDEAPWGEWFLASSCLALMVLVWDQQRPPGGVCAADRCARVYLAQGSGMARRYCSRRCATRSRVAAHRARS